MLTIETLAKEIGLKILVEGDLNRQIKTGYCGDLLSWVMSKAQQDDAWFTVMGNVNSIAVAVLTDVSCIILTEDAVLDSDAKNKAEMQEVTVLSSDKSAYALSVTLSKLLDE